MESGYLFLQDGGLGLMSVSKILTVMSVMSAEDFQQTAKGQKFYVLFDLHFLHPIADCLFHIYKSKP